MPTFDTPEPIAVQLDLVAGDVDITTGHGGQTVVEVRPTSGTRTDVRAAEQTTVDYADGTLVVRMAKPQWRSPGRLIRGVRRAGAVTVAITVPAGSGVRGEAAVGYLHAEGRLGECRFTTASGNIALDETGPLTVDTAFGTVTVDRITGHAEITTHGEVRIGEIDGTAVIKNLNGRSDVGKVAGSLHVNGVNGDIAIGRVDTDAAVTTATGNLRIGEVIRGSVVLETSAGSVEVGVREGTVAWVDAHTAMGSVHNALDGFGPPEPPAEAVELRARTLFGAIDIHRA